VWCNGYSPFALKQTPPCFHIFPVFPFLCSFLRFFKSFSLPLFFLLSSVFSNLLPLLLFGFFFVLFPCSLAPQIFSSFLSFSKNAPCSVSGSPLVFIGGRGRGPPYPAQAQGKVVGAWLCAATPGHEFPVFSLW